MRFAVPSIIALVVNSLYNMVDQIFIGNGVGNAIVATIGFGIVFTILCESFLEPLCMMFGATEESISYCLSCIVSLVVLMVYWKKVFNTKMLQVILD